MIRRTMMCTAALALGACGGGKAPAPDTSAGALPAPAAAAPPAAAPAADNAKADSASLATESATKAAASATNPAIVGPAAVNVTPAKADSVGFDKAMKPKYQIDEKTGKVTPIKRP